MKYSYLIYKIYCWTAFKPGETPVFTTVMTLAVVHMFQLFTVLPYLNAFFRFPHFFDVGNGYVVVGAFAWFGLLHVLIYNKERWAGYIQQYQGENEHESKRGDYKAMAFCAGSVLAFFVSLPLSFTLLRALAH